MKKPIGSSDGDFPAVENAPLHREEGRGDQEVKSRSQPERIEGTQRPRPAQPEKAWENQGRQTEQCRPANRGEREIARLPCEKQHLNGRVEKNGHTKQEEIQR